MCLKFKEDDVTLLSGSYQSSEESQMSLWQIAKATKVPCLSIFLNLCTTLLGITFYSFVPSSGDFASLVQILNYTGLIGIKNTQVVIV